MSHISYRLFIVPAVIVIDTDNKLVAIQKHPKSASFVDVLEEFPVYVWGNKSVLCGSKEWKYDEWFSLEGEDNFRDYLHTLIKQHEQHN